jgi:hypothetical protein
MGWVGLTLIQSTGAPTCYDVRIAFLISTAR